MSDLVTSRVFVDGEKGITAAKLNDIVASSVIQPAFYTSKPTAGTADPTDIALILKSGAYAQVPVSTLGGSATQAQIWSTRLRSFNAIGNPNFEVDQISAGASATAGKSIDRWFIGRSGTSALTVQQVDAVAGVGGGVLLPGTSYAITGKFHRTTLTATQSSLGASDLISHYQLVEGPQWRELKGDVHSLSMLVRTSVAGLQFGVSLVDQPATKSLVNLSPALAANVWTLVTFPNLANFPAGNFSSAPGVTGYMLRVTLAAGTTYMAPAGGTWQTGYFFGAPGQSNFAASPINSTFDIAMVQHEPGAVCSTLMDKPFTQNLDECLRYYYKTYDYQAAIGLATGTGIKTFIAPSATANAFGPFQFPKPMAKTPTITFYNYATGSANSVRDGFSTDHASASAVNPCTNGFQYLTFSGATTGAVQVYTQFTADTGM